MGHEVCGIDLAAGNRGENGDIRKDLFSLGKVWFKHKPEVIFHLAAQPSVQWSVDNPSEALSHNVLGTSRVLEFAKHVNCRRVIFASSAAVYGDGGPPCSPYGLHKLVSEQECRLYSKLYGLDTVCLRYYNAYSANQKYGGAYSTVISAWMEMQKQNKPLRIDGDGTQTRDFVHLDDIVDANIFCMNYKGKFNGASYDVATGESVSLNELKTQIDQITNVEWETAPPRCGDIKDSIANYEALEDIGWRSQITINKGLRACFGEK